MPPELEHTEARLKQLESAVREVFDGVPRPSRYQIALHQCEECEELRDAFDGQDWHKMGCQYLEEYHSALPLLSAEALPYFLPAYLLCALSDFDPDNIVAEFTVYCLAPDLEQVGAVEHCSEKFRHFTADQMRVLAAFMRLVNEAENFRTQLGLVEHKHEALQALWAKRWD